MRVAKRSPPPVLAREVTVHTLRCDRCGGSFEPFDVDAPPHGARRWDEDGDTGQTVLTFLYRFAICGGCLEEHVGVLENVEPI